VRSPSSVRDAIPAPAELSGTPSTSVRCVPTVAAVLRTRNFPRTLRPARQSCRGTTSDHGIGPRPQPTRLDCRGNLAVSPGTHSTPGRGLSSSPPRRSRSSRLTSRGWSARRITPSADRRICSISGPIFVVCGRTCWRSRPEHRLWTVSATSPCMLTNPKCQRPVAGSHRKSLGTKSDWGR
jgi:hypothetical protein